MVNVKALALAISLLLTCVGLLAYQGGVFDPAPQPRQEQPQPQSQDDRWHQQIQAGLKALDRE